jgi:FolB domain-containing protein
MIVRIKNLHLRTQIGIFDWEKNKAQDVVLNITMNSSWADQAGESDQIEDTLDYKKIRNEIAEMVEGKNYGLIEKIARDTCHHLFEQYPIDEVSVEVDKPGALRFAESVSAEYYLSK